MPRNDIDFDNCLKCSDCNTACPVSTAHPAYPGPKHLGPELERLRREGLPCDSDWLEYCLGCHRCDLACPSQVNVAELIAQAKARHRKPLRRRIRDFWFARPGLLGRLMTVLPGASNAALGFGGTRVSMSFLAGITASRRFPAYVKREVDPAPETRAGGDKIVFFPGCAIQYNQPDLGSKAVALLRRAGFSVTVNGAHCCGLPALANGDAGEARRAAAANVAALSTAVEEGARIVTACTSCGHMLKTGFADLLGAGPAESRARAVAERTYDLGELVMERAEGMAGMPAPARRSWRLAYHAPCHQVSQGMGRPWFHLLRQVPGVDILDLDAGCCGMAGTFGFKDEKYPVSMAVGQRLFQEIRKARPEIVVSECATCRMQIGHATGVRTMHPAELLLDALSDTAEK